MKKIKYIILATVLFFLFTSCKKEDVVSTEKTNCNCGIVVDTSIKSSNDGKPCYWIEVLNNCTNNKKLFCIDQDIWLKIQIGEYVCMSEKINW